VFPRRLVKHHDGSLHELRPPSRPTGPSTAAFSLTFTMPGKLVPPSIAPNGCLERSGAAQQQARLSAAAPSRHKAGAVCLSAPATADGLSIRLAVVRCPQHRLSKGYFMNKSDNI
jgi:hypothetical protein